MELEIESQSELLSQNCSDTFNSAKEALHNKKYEMVLLVARGSSDHAALYARYLIEIHLGIPVSLAAPSVLTRFGTKVKYPKCLAIGISQSGAGPDVAEVLHSLKGEGNTVLAVTNSPDSLITQVADSTILLNCGIEKSVAATKSYSMSLLAMIQIVRALGGKLPDPINELPNQNWMNQCREEATKSYGIFNRANPIFCLARGYDFCTAQETALKLMECALIPAKSYSTADFQHGPKALAGPGSAALIYSESVDELESQGCQVVMAPSPICIDPFKPLWNVIYGQWLALLAARGRGLNPDDPKFIHKITRTL